jgi:outer membrane protein assembly factor BamB
MVTPGRKPLRLWPGVIIVILQWLVRFALPMIAPATLYYGVIGGVLCGLLVVLWWVFLSRAPWFERVGAIVLMVAAMFATSRILDQSIATGAQGMLFPILAIPVLSLAFVVWAVATSHLPDGVRRATMIVTILIASGAWAAVRTGGLTADFKNDLHWRWNKSPEERLLAQLAKEPPALQPAPATVPAPESGATIPEKTADKVTRTQAGVERTEVASIPTVVEREAEWPGFRGRNRDSIIPGVQINTDWTASPPAELWRRSIGPGWSSFAVRGDFLYTQEQRGSDEVVACYQLATGRPVWTHRDATRFWESNGGPGPRATPMLGKNRVYTFGATGVLNALNANDGSVVWSRNAASDAGMKVPQWGFAGSPLVTEDAVIVGVAGRLVAYDIAAGSPRWLGPSRGVSYSSPHLVTLDGVAQILLLSDYGATSVALADGALLWDYKWKGYPMVQPALTAEGDILISVNESGGIRRLSAVHSAGKWSVEERWASIGLKPYFNDFVLHNGYAFGFDGSILACIDLKDGSRKWKGGRYGNGQLILLQDQDLLLAVTEQGELALVQAKPDRFNEVARFPGIEGKTWNHPVLVHNVLLVRNGEEMAAFRLAPAAR